MAATGRVWQVDADLRGQGRRLWAATLEAQWMRIESLLQNLLTGGVALGGLAEVHRRAESVNDFETLSFTNY